MSDKVVPVLAFVPSTPLAPRERGDNGRGPLPKDSCGGSRHVNLKSPGKGKGGSVSSPAKRSGRPKLSLPLKG